MRITVSVKTNARKNVVEKLAESSYRVSVTAPPVDGKANEKIIELLARHFGKPKRCVRILRGESSKQKVIEIF